MKVEDTLFTLSIMKSILSLFFVESSLLYSMDVSNEFIFCFMENKANIRSSSFANTIERNNLCSHFMYDLHSECMEYMEIPSYTKDTSVCVEFMGEKHLQNKNEFLQQWDQYIDFVMDYQKVFEDKYEIISRFHIFHDNLEWITEHNRDPSHTYTVGIRRFADMTHNEYKEFVKSGGLSFDKGDDANLRGNLGIPKDMCGTMKSESGTYPKSVDWRTKGAVTPVRDQGQQGTCYAHSASEALESAYFIKKGTLPNLSVQQIVDCSYNYGNHGNNGGMYTYSWTYIHDSGLTTESAYPYTAGPSDRSSCKSFTPYTYVSDCKHVPANELQLTYAVTHQPVSVAIEADSRSFQHYTSGVYSDPSCGTTIDHAVVVVGYGNMDGQDYWAVRNSWGTSWGVDGYIYIARNSVATSTVGQCAIATYAAYPIV